MHCCYVYDHGFGLFALTAIHSSGRQWTAVPDEDEWDRLVRVVAFENTRNPGAFCGSTNCGL